MRTASLTSFLLPLLLIGMSLPCSAENGRPAVSGFFQHTDLGWMKNPYWFQGDAEINLYRASLVKYGQARSTDGIVHILVTEKHKPDLLVKADNWRQPGLVDMLKFNQVIEVQTGVYSHRQMLSVFFNQEDLHVAKMSLASHEWCGNSFKELVNFAGRSSFEFNTYWDGQGSGRFEVDFPGDLSLYDALPVQLRMLRFRSGLSTTIELLPTQISSRATEPKVATAKISVLPTAEVSVPAGDFRAHPVVVEHGEGQDRLWFEVEFPNRMLRWETYDGNRYELRSSKKLAYWKLNRPGDETYLD